MHCDSRWILTLIFMTTLGQLSCSSGLKKNDHELRHIFLQNLQMRRPPELTTPGSNPRFDCVKFEELPTDTGSLQSDPERLAKIRTCLIIAQSMQNESGESITLTYKLKRETMPVLKLDLNEVLPPACIRETLLQIPVPREIFFQSNQETQQSHLEDSQQDPDQMRCYSARLPLSSDDGLGLKNWLHQSEVVIRFPIQNVPLTDDETLTLLKTWALAPYWNEERNAIIGNIVPDDLCMQCMGGPKSFFKDLRKVKEASPPMWP